MKVTRYRGQESLPPLEFAIQHSYRKLENAESTPKTTGKAANCGNYIIHSPKLGLLLCDFEISTGLVVVSLMFLYKIEITSSRSYWVTAPATATHAQVDPISN